MKKTLSRSGTFAIHLLLGLVFCAMAAVASATTQTLRIVTYNIQADTTFTTPMAGLITPFSGTGTYTTSSSGTVTDGGVLEGIGEEILGNDPAQPIDILALNETTSNSTTVQPIVNGLNAFYSAHGPSAGYAMSTYQATESGGNPGTGNGPSALVYNTNTVQLIASVPVDPSGGTSKLGSSSGEYREVMRYELAPAGVTATASNEFYIYVSHYKAETGATNQKARAGEAGIIRTNSASLPSNARVLYVGDYNISTSTETSYQAIVNNTIINYGIQGVDPFNLTGATGIDWTTSSLMNEKSESGRSLSARFDFQLMSSNVYYGVAGGLAYVSGTYHTFGNNGTTPFDKSAIVTNNTALNSSLQLSPPISAAQCRTNLYGASDHYPVVADYTIPVTAPTGPDLTLTKTHGGNFNQGDTGDTYTIIVTNVGNDVSSGAVTVSDSLPAGLTATALSGTGWTANLGSLTCTRSDALAAGAAYPPITVTVNVSGNAAASVINTATVSGGGEGNTANDTANDPTTINTASLSVSPSSGLASSGTAGGPFSPISQTYTLSNSGGASMNWTASKTATWLTLSATSGTLAGGGSTTITVSINSGANSLSAGGYSDTVSFANALNGAGNTTRAVSLTVNSPAQLSVTASSGLTSSGIAGGPFSPISQTYTLSNSGGSSMNWTASKTATWLTLSATSGTLAGGASTTVTVSINSGANSLSASSYSDTVSFTNATNDAGDTTRAVSLTVNPTAAQLSVSGSSGLTSSGIAGGPFSPISQTYTLSNSGGTSMNWTASKTATWLTLSATSGTLAGGASTTVTVSINSGANSLSVGGYSDTVAFNNTSNDAGDTTRAVSLTVNPTTALLSVSGSSGLTSSGIAGGPFSPISQTYTLSNNGGASMNWTASKTASWLTLSATSGTLAGGASTTVTVSINSGANSLSAGNYSDTVSFTNTTNDAGDTTRAVSLNITSYVPVSTVISGVHATNVTQMTATIQWTTDVSSDSRVLYGTSPSTVNNLVSVGGNVTSHSVKLTALSPGTLYYYDVCSGSSTNDNQGAHYTFTTTTPCPCN